MSFKTANLLDKKSTSTFIDLLTNNLKSWYSRWFFNGVPKIEIETNQSLFGDLACDDGYEVIDHHHLILFSSTKKYEDELFCYAYDFDKHKLRPSDSTIIHEYNKEIFHDLYLSFDLNNDKEKVNSQIFAKVLITINKTKLVLNFTSRFIERFIANHSKNNRLKPVDLISLIDTEVDINIPMLTNRIDIQKLTQLKVGDVIKLNQEIKEPIPLKINQTSTSIGSFFVSQNNQKAIIITE